MKKLYLFSALTILLIFSCGKNESEFKLESGTPAFELATELSKTLPLLDPTENNVIISSNEFNITSGELIYNINKNMGNRASQLKDLAEPQLKENIDRFANILGERKLLLLEAKKSNINNTKSEIDSILNMQYQRLGGKEKFIQFLETNGQTIEDIRGDIVAGLTIQKYIKEIQDGVEISEEEIENAYNDVKTVTVRHILFSTRGKNDIEKQQQKEKIEEILGKARNGEDFAELAKQYSEDPGSKAKGGLYENVQRGMMVKPFEDAAFSVPVGEISDIIETQYGYHILTVLDRKKETKPLAEVRQTLEKNLQQQKSNKAFQNQLDDLKTQYEYEVVKL
jgi:parvulin-like peptidyl-prolyl isomerase